MSIMCRTIGQSYYQLHSLYTMQHHRKELKYHHLKQIMGIHLGHHYHQDKQRSQAK